MKITIGLTDDHQLFRKSVAMMLENLPGFEVVVIASNGKDLQEKLEAGSPLPHIMLIDVQMPVMNGLETVRWMRATHPQVKLVALSMSSHEHTIIEMINAGCCSYLDKNTDPDELEEALKEIFAKNYYNSELNDTNLATLLLTNQSDVAFQISEKEREFLKHAMRDITYKQIAILMSLSERTIDGYRESLFAKFNVQSRTGMVMEALRKGLVRV